MIRGTSPGAWCNLAPSYSRSSRPLRAVQPLPSAASPSLGGVFRRWSASVLSSRGYAQGSGFSALRLTWQKGNAGMSVRWFGDSHHACACAPLAVQRYLARVSGPLLDRIDIHLEVPAVKYKALTGESGGEPSEAMRERVDRARTAASRTGLMHC